MLASFIFTLVFMARADDLMLREPQVNAENSFSLSASSTAAIKLESTSEFDVYAFKSALQSCDLSKAELRSLLAPLLEKNTANEDGEMFWPYLNYLYPQARVQVLAKKPVILISSFSARARDVFASFYLTRYSELSRPAIVLDCSGAGRVYWRPTLAHEISHLLADGKGYPSWLDEMLAQIMEHVTGGLGPPSSMNDLSSGIRAEAVPLPLPSFLLFKRPFANWYEYSVNYLLGEYILTRFGGWETLRAMIDRNADLPEVRACEHGMVTSAIFCRAQMSLRSRNFSNQIVSRMSESVFERFFAVAMTFNISNVDLYSIPGWNLHATSWHWLNSNELAVTHLAPGQFVLAQPGASVSRFNPDLEAYIVDLSKALPTFAQVNSIDGSSDKPILIINTKSTDREELISGVMSVRASAISIK